MDEDFLKKNPDLAEKIKATSRELLRELKAKAKAERHGIAKSGQKPAAPIETSTHSKEKKAPKLDKGI